MMAVPAATAFEFGLGTEAAEWTGKERNDDWEFDDSEAHRASDESSAEQSSADSQAAKPRDDGDEPRTWGNPTPVENDHGGIQGGISSGEPIYGEVTLHAPTSIPKAQQTADWETGELKEEKVIGRHDPVLPPRGVPVVEAMLALTLVDFMLLSGRLNPDRVDDQPGKYDTDYHPSNPRNE